jgi:hypothetical protein
VNSQQRSPNSKNNQRNTNTQRERKYNMNHPIYLTEEEICGITNRKQRTAQIRALIEMGIDCKTRPDGSPLVSRLAYERNMGGIDPKNIPEESPDLSSLNVAQTQKR